MERAVGDATCCDIPPQRRGAALTEVPPLEALRRRAPHRLLDPLDVPATWEQVRDVAEYFNGKDLNGDGEPDHGVVLPLMAGSWLTWIWLMSSKA